MIIKVMKKGNDYWMCDNVDSIDVSVIQEKQDISPSLEISKVIASIFEEREHGNPVAQHGMAITFFDKLGDRCVILFNTVAYICNDQGKTVETIFG